MEKKSPKLYKIDWIDAFAEGGWKKLADLPKQIKPMSITTVGWFIHEDKDYLVFAQNISNDEKYADTMSIPKKWIKRRTRL